MGLGKTSTRATLSRPERKPRISLQGVIWFYSPSEFETKHKIHQNISEKYYLRAHTFNEYGTVKKPCLWKRK